MAASGESTPPALSAASSSQNLPLSAPPSLPTSPPASGQPPRSQPYSAFVGAQPFPTYPGAFPEADLRVLIARQVEYYFSPQNLAKDTYLRSRMDDQHYVPCSLIANFNAVKRLTQNYPLVLDVMKSCPSLEVDAAKELVRPRNYSPPTSHEAVVVLRDCIPKGTPITEVQALFEAGPRPVLVKERNDVWHVTFESDVAAQLAVERLRTITFKGAPIHAHLTPQVSPLPSPNPVAPSFHYPGPYPPMSSAAPGGFSSFYDGGNNPMYAPMPYPAPWGSFPGYFPYPIAAGGNAQFPVFGQAAMQPTHAAAAAGASAFQAHRRKNGGGKSNHRRSHSDSSDATAQPAKGHHGKGRKGDGRKLGPRRSSGGSDDRRGSGGAAAAAPVKQETPDLASFPPLGGSSSSSSSSSSSKAPAQMARPHGRSAADVLQSPPRPTDEPSREDGAGAAGDALPSARAKGTGAGGAAGDGAVSSQARSSKPAYAAAVAASGPAAAPPSFAAPAPAPAVQSTTTTTTTTTATTTAAAAGGGGGSGGGKKSASPPKAPPSAAADASAGGSPANAGGGDAAVANATASSDGARQGKASWSDVIRKQSP